MPQSNADTEISTLIRARYPIIYIVSYEERRVEDAIASISYPAKKLYTWSASQGIMPRPAVGGAIVNILAALEFADKCDEQAIFLFKDMHAYLSDSTVIRVLRDLARNLTSKRKTIIILSPILKLPPELEKDITVVDYPLPSYSDLSNLLEVVVDKLRRDKADVDVHLSSEDYEQVIKSAQGLTLIEAENVFARSLVLKRTLDPGIIMSEKEQIIRKSGLLEYYPLSSKFSDVGGLESLKDWLKKRKSGFTEKARKFGLPEPRGIMLLGVQGCGKSLSCKAVGSLWNLPLLRLDVGKIFSGTVGSSESNIRKAIQVAESVAPVVLWVDEMEKGFAGVKSSPFSDAGTTSRVFGTFITWLQEKKSAVFVVATANDISALPPELLRKGRFDEIFFVDLPSDKEREDIFKIHLASRNRAPERFDMDSLVVNSEGFSGAEIEEAIVSALFTAYDADAELSNSHIINELKTSVPLSVTMSEQISELRDWASRRTRPASKL